MLSKKQINDCIEFIEKMEVLVNYKNNKFLGKEEEYKKSKTNLARNANKKMLMVIPDAKEQIAKAFIPFIKEVEGELEILIATNNKRIAELYLQNDSVYAKKKMEKQ